MNKRKIFTGAGALLLLVTGALVGKASSKFLAVGDIYYTNGTANSCTAIETGGSITGLLTTGASTTQATLKTQNGGHAWNLYSTSLCGSTHKIHFKG